MPTLYATSCSTDWKGRPSHQLRILGTSESREELIAIQNADVEQWKAESLEGLQQIAQENIDEGEDDEIPTVWELENMRFEMEGVEQREGLRQFVEDNGDGDLWTLVYHIL